MSEPLRLRVITFNIHGGRPPVGLVHLDMVANVIRDLQPDLVGLQEVHRWMPPPYVFQNQPERLRKLLGMEVYFCPAFGLGPTGYGNAILSRTRADLVRRTRLPGAWKAPEPRILLEARFTLDGRGLRFLTTHLGLTQEVRGRQAGAIVDRIRSYRDPVLVVGDFNAVPETAEMRRFEITRMADCASADVLTYPCDKPKCRIDHILASPHFEVANCWAGETFVSDHRPLVADLVLK